MYRGRGIARGRFDWDLELSKPAVATFLFILLSLVPLGSYFYMHRTLARRYALLEEHMIAEMKEVTKLKQDVASFAKVRDTLSLTSSALKAALRSFGRPLPAGLEDALQDGEGFSLASGGQTTADLNATQQGYIRVPSEQAAGSCTPDGSAFTETRPYAWSNFFKAWKHPGVFVELGAGDGEYRSPTYFLERALCWTGLLVEPSDGEFAKLLTNRPRSTAVHGAACPNDGEAKERFLEVTLNGLWTGWSGFPSHFDPAHSQAINERTGRRQEGGAAEQWAAREADVACFRLDTLLRRQELRRVDFMSVSVVGAELEVLQAMNFEEVEVGVIEVDVSGDEHALASFLASKGFVQHSTHSTRAHVFLHRNFSSTSEAA
uniref:Family methyltransferase n=1 Tax=Tetraselmis sp. GSL018 TaxID=582737 RepID=A0A061RXP8_9CHLO|mmetsp:Transcript_34688/g.82266  ORF Transcript_34688/g.82266 Transcript_34688/m.82266 type:complete len:376 (+) Transcript_34688:276-1403(+)